MDNYTQFEEKLERFIDRYYKFSIYRGIILFVILSAIIILAISYLEFLGWFNYSGRLFLFLFGFISSFFIFNYFFIIPILRYFGILNRLTKRKTELILRENLPEIKDYVLNIIELKELQRNTINDLVIASINQKIVNTGFIDFQVVFTIKKLYPFFKYLASIVLLYLIIFIFKPAVISEGSNRIIHFSKEYNKAIGYSIQLNDSNLVVEKGGNFDFSATINGEIVPEFLSYYLGNTEYLMTRKNSRYYSATIKNVNKTFSFRVGNEQFKSQLYSVQVVQPPFLSDFKILIDYPDYINKESEVLDRIANVKIPLGSKIKWEFTCLNVDKLKMHFENDSSYFNKKSDLFYFDTTILISQYYYVKGSNNDLARELVPKSFISVIPDLYPEISISQVFDENNKKLVYFKGHVFDDYGFINLYFLLNSNKISIPINTKLNNQDFFFSYEFNSDEEKKFTYYFEVFDNDDINGSKSSKSNNFYFTIPDYNALADYKKEQDKEIFEKMEKSLLLAEEFKRDIENIKEKLYSEKLSTFEKQQLIEGLKNKQNSLEQIMNDFLKQNSDKNKQFDSFSQQNQELLQKQESIQKLLESVMTDELKALLDELEKLSLENRNNDLNNQLDKLELNYDQLSEQLDKNLELLQKYEIEKELDLISNELNTISENQHILAEEKMDNSVSDSLSLKDKDKIEKLEKQFKEIIGKNNELENPMKLENLDNKFEELNLNMDIPNDTEKLSDTERKSKHSENSIKSKELSDEIKQMINNNRVNENGENSETLRQILENLIYFSFAQETVNESFNITSINSPIFFENIKTQLNLLENFSLIKDSLLALSKRTPSLGNFISQKVYEIESGLLDIKFLLNVNNLSKCRLEQRNVLETSNDLILLLSESLKNMENSGEGNGSCSKPKKKQKQSKPSLGDMRKSQESIKSQLESMIKMMKEGAGKNGKPSSERLAQMLAQQEIFQQMMNQLQNGSGVGSDFQKKLNEINQLLEQNKRDLIRNDIDQSTLLRQNKIVTRLLEAEKSEMERELDETRKSKEASTYLLSKPSHVLFEQENMNINFNDILNSNSLKLNYFYKNKYQEYIKELN